MLTVLITMHLLQNPDIRELDLKNEFDRLCREEMDYIDSSFMKWKFTSRLRWTTGDTSTSPLEGILVNRKQIEDLGRHVSKGHNWIPIVFALAHEKSHLVQSEVYGADLARHPRLVLEAQADIMAASFTYLRIMKIMVSFDSEGRLVYGTNVLERDAEASVVARKAEMIDLLRLSMNLGRTRNLGTYPEPWERSQATALGLFAATGMMKLNLGLIASQDEFRREIGFQANEDFASWTLRKAYELLGIPLGSNDSYPRFNLATASDPIGAVIRRSTEEVPRSFSGVKGKLLGRSEKIVVFESTLSMPEYHHATVHVDSTDSSNVWIRFARNKQFPEDMELRLYEGMKFRLERFLREGWDVDEESVSESKRTISWLKSDGSLLIMLTYLPKASEGKTSVILIVE